MSNDEILTDDYVAGLLAKEASDCSLKFSAMGMEAYESTKKPSNMPKPNKRFLRNIIKDTDTHNNRLLAKEAAESKARLEDLEHSEEVKRLKTNPNARDVRRRQMGHIHSILGGKKLDNGTRREEGESGSGRDSRKRHHRERGRDDRRSTSGRDDDLFKKHGRSRPHGRLSPNGGDDGDNEHEGHRHSDRSSRRRRRHGSPTSEDDTKRRRHSRRDRDRSRSADHGRRRSRRSHSPSTRMHRRRHRSPLAGADGSKNPPKHTEEDGDSDPLEDLIGPMPAPIPRGRGALAGSSGIDQRFSDTYDPKTDVAMDEEDLPGPRASSRNTGDQDWESKVEMFRDGQKLRHHQSTRLREAGFSEDVIRRAEGGQAEEDVRWSRAGEEREWDRDKDAGQ